MANLGAISKLSFIFVLTLSSSFLIVESLASNTENYDKCNATRADLCALEWTFVGIPDFPYPTESGELIRLFCKPNKLKEKCIREYADCLSTDAKRTFSVMLFSISRTNKGLCTSKKRPATLKANECIKPVAPQLAGLTDELTKNFHLVRDFDDIKLRIPLLCCVFYDYKGKVVNLVSDRCTNEVAEFIEGVISGYSGDIINFACGDYTEESDKCKKIMTKIPTPNKNTKYPYKSFVMPMIEAINTI